MANKVLSNTKISNFYGKNIARPYVVFNESGLVEKDRVDAPRINDALIEWASKVPFGQGGSLRKPVFDGEKIPEARNEFQIFLTERYNDILAANPGLALQSDQKVLLAVGSTFWKDHLTPEERQAYKERAAEEKSAVAAQIAAAEESNPKFKAFRKQLQLYKQSMGSMLSAAKAQAGPLWKLQRRMNAKYKAMEKRENGASEAGAEADALHNNDSRKKKGGKKSGGLGANAALGRGHKGKMETQGLKGGDGARREELASTAAAAAGELEGLRLEEGGRKAGVQGGTRKGRLLLAARRTSATATEAAGSKQASSTVRVEVEQKGAGVLLPSRQQQSSMQRTADTISPAKGSSAIQLLQKLSRRTRGSKLYDGEYDLPASQAATPAKGIQAAAGAAAGSAGKRTRRGATSASGAAADVEMTLLSPTKKLRAGASRRL